jgi:hypothetical protein
VSKAVRRNVRICCRSASQPFNSLFGVARLIRPPRQPARHTAGGISPRGGPQKRNVRRKCPPITMPPIKAQKGIRYSPLLLLGPPGAHLSPAAPAPQCRRRTGLMPVSAPASSPRPERPTPTRPAACRRASSPDRHQPAAAHAAHRSASVYWSSWPLQTSVVVGVALVGTPAVQLSAVNESEAIVPVQLASRRANVAASMPLSSQRLSSRQQTHTRVACTRRFAIHKPARKQGRRVAPSLRGVGRTSTSHKWQK